MSKIDASVKSRFFAKVQRGPDCWIWTGAKRRGYGVITIQGETYLAHRIMAVLERPEMEETLLTKRKAKGYRTDYVLHSCDNPSCVNPAHLRLGDASENSRDMVDRGRSTRGLLPARVKGEKRQPYPPEWAEQEGPGAWTPEQFRAAMDQLGMSIWGMSEALRLGRYGNQMVSKWARGIRPIPGPVQVAVELMLEQAEFAKIERMK
jgi:hypothetical protein